MKEMIFLLSVLFISVVVLFIAALWDAMTKGNATESELHARDRYAVAEKIQKEFENRRE